MNVQPQPPPEPPQDKEFELKKLVSQAIQLNYRASFGSIEYLLSNQNIDPLFPQVDIKIKQLEMELAIEKIGQPATQLELSGKL